MFIVHFDEELASGEGFSVVCLIAWGENGCWCVE
jgi:hypothetical protein